jgi:hypothetical protein
MNEVAAMSVRAVTLVEEAETWFCFVGSVRYTVASKFLWAMSKLAFRSVGTKPVNHEILAERALYLGCFLPGILTGCGGGVILRRILGLVSRCIRLRLVRRVLVGVMKSVCNHCKIL